MTQQLCTAPSLAVYYLVANMFHWFPWLFTGGRPALAGVTQLLTLACVLRSMAYDEAEQQQQRQTTWYIAPPVGMQNCSEWDLQINPECIYDVL